jgi:cytochrome c oxidase cbb3-type subunit I/II
MIGTLVETPFYMLLFGLFGHFVTVAVLHIFNSLALPVSGQRFCLLCSDALVQWVWHTVVSFLNHTFF